MLKISSLAMLLAVLMTSVMAGETPAPSQSPGSWVNVTSNVGGDTWGYAGVTLVSGVPNSSDIIAGVSERGLWISSDNGTSWKKLGENDREPIKHRPHKITYDPQNPANFWVSGCYSIAGFRTTDAGKTFQKLGALSHADGVTVDFTDPERKTLLMGMHEQERSLQLSQDGGKTWKKIGDKLPENSNFSTDPIIVDSKTFIINSAGYKKLAFGIFRSEDAGQTWTQVSTFGPAGTPLITAEGTMYWQRIWGGGLLQSTDKGKTWNALNSPVKSNLIELPDKRLAGFTENQIYISSDGGMKWTKAGPPVPFKPSGITYSGKGKSFYAWHLSDKKTDQAISRLIYE